MDGIDRGGYGPWTIGGIALAAVLGMATNWRTARHVRESFNTGEAVFALVFGDAVVSACGSAMLLVFAAAAAGFTHDAVTCSVPFLATHIATTCGLVVSAEVAAIR